MQVNVILQKENENTLASVISSSLEKNAKKAYFFIGNFKDTGFKVIEESLIDIKTKLFFVIGIDKKATTRSMLEGLLNYSNDVYYYSNNNLVEYVSSLIVFEYTDKAEMYVGAANISESGIQSDISLYTKITYDLDNSEDKKAYKDEIKKLQKIVEEDGFAKLDKDKIKILVEQKEIFSTRQFNHSVMSISELIGKAQMAKQKDDDTNTLKDEQLDFSKAVEIPKVDLNNSDIEVDIDIPVEENKNNEEVEDSSIKIEVPKDETVTIPKEEYNEYEENNEETKADENDDIDYDKTLDINDLLFSKADLKLDITDEKRKKKSKKKEENPQEEDSIVKVKKVNLNDITNLIFELSAKNSKETDAIRVPNYIKKMIPTFFNVDDSDSQEIDGVVCKVKKINLEIVDVKNNEKYKDEDAVIAYKPGQSYVRFISNKLNNILYNEKDIIRIIKLDDTNYHMEIIDKGMQEYHVWKKLCTQTFRQSDKKYGMM